TRPDTVHVTFGTLLNDVLLELPVQSRVTLDNGSPLTVPVSWEPGDYLHDQWGTYALPGTLQLPAGVVNPDDLADTIIVSVSKQFITEVDSLNPLTAAYGTSFGNLPLPADVRVSYNDGTDGMINVIWEQENYNGSSEGIYTIKGKLLVPDDIDNPDSLNAVLQVQIEPRKKNLISLETD